MKRYYTLKRPRANDDWQWYEEPPKVAATTVYEPEDKHIFSGIYDAQGQPLYRAAMQPIGFLAQHED